MHTLKFCESVTSLMILLHSRINIVMHTKQKVTLLNVLVLNLNGRKVIVLWNIKLKLRKYISAFIVRIGQSKKIEFLSREHPILNMSRASHFRLGYIFIVIHYA